MKKLGFLVLALAAGCAAKRPSDGAVSAAAVSSPPSFLSGLQHTATFTDEYDQWSMLAGASFSSDPRSYRAAIVEAGPVPIFTVDRHFVSFIDAQGKHVDRGVLPAFEGKPLFSADNTWFAYKATDGTVEAQPLNSGPQLPWLSGWDEVTWAGNDLVVRNDTKIVAMDRMNKSELWHVDLPTDVEPPSFAVSADEKTVLLYTSSWARIVDTASGVAKAVDDWDQYTPAQSCDAPRDLVVKPRGTSDFEVGNGALFIVQPNASVIGLMMCTRDHASLPDGTIAVATVAGAGTFVQPPDNHAYTIALDGPVSFSADGKWLIGAQGLYKLDGTQPVWTFPRLPATGVEEVIYRKNHTEAFVRTGVAGHGTIWRYDVGHVFSQSVQTWVYGTTESGQTSYDPEGDNFVLAYGETQLLVDPIGNVIATRTDGIGAGDSEFEQPIGWSGGVFYFTAFRRDTGFLTLRALTKDGKFDVEVLPRVDELVAARSVPEPGAPLSRIVMRSKNELYTLTPAVYVSGSTGTTAPPPVDVPVPVPAGDDDDGTPATPAPQPKPGGGFTVNVTPKSTPPKTDEETVMACASTPGTRGSSGALVLATLCLATLVRRRSGSRSRSTAKRPT